MTTPVPNAAQPAHRSDPVPSRPSSLRGLASEHHEPGDRTHRRPRSGAGTVDLGTVDPPTWHPQSFRGRVVHGAARGRDLGFPTANVRLPSGLRPPFGVYAGRLDGRAAAISVGVRPTFGDDHQPLLEAHVLDFTGDLYGREVQVELVSFRRHERRFANVKALIAQMHEDVEDVRELLGADAVERAVSRLRRGEAIVLQDAERDISYLTVAAADCDADRINVMARSACGLVCLALPADHCDRLGLTALRRDESTYPTVPRLGPHPRPLPFTASIEARDGVSTGISTADRARTIAVASAPDARADDIVVPGHVFPLRAERRGTTPAGIPEAAVALAELADRPPAAVVCAVLDRQGDVARGPALAAFLERLGLPLVTTAEVDAEAAQSVG